MVCQHHRHWTSHRLSIDALRRPICHDINSVCFMALPSCYTYEFETVTCVGRSNDNFDVIGTLRQQNDRNVWKCVWQWRATLVLFVFVAVGASNSLFSISYTRANARPSDFLRAYTVSDAKHQIHSWFATRRTLVWRYWCASYCLDCHCARCLLRAVGLDLLVGVATSK